MTSSDLKKAKVPISNLFAYGIDADCHSVDTSASGFTYQAGIPSTYSSINGKKVCRGDMNGLGRSITQSKWFNQLGGYYTFSKEVSDSIGGYPQGAILYYKDIDTGKIRTVRSLIADNTYDFVDDPSLINGEYWQYVDNVPPSGFRPRIFQDFFNINKDSTTNSLRVGEMVLVDKPCVFMIQTGCDSIDCTNDGTDYSMYVTVKRKDDTVFYTAGLICYLPPLSSVVSQGILSDERYENVANRTKEGLHAFNSPSLIQLYLLPGDTVKLSGSRDFSEIENETFNYWIVPLHA